jgi:hypothetical protein
MKVLFALFSSFSLLSAADPLTLPLWPEGPGPRVPTSAATQKMIDGYGKPSATHVTPVIDPTLTFYRVANAHAPCVVVAPGGGYMFLSYSFEGTAVCEWLNSIEPVPLAAISVKSLGGVVLGILDCRLLVRFGSPTVLWWGLVEGDAVFSLPVCMASPLKLSAS